MRFQLREVLAKAGTQFVFPANPLFEETILLVWGNRCQSIVVVEAAKLVLPEKLLPFAKAYVDKGKGRIAPVASLELAEDLTASRRQVFQVDDDSLAL